MENIERQYQHSRIPLRLPAARGRSSRWLSSYRKAGLSKMVDIYKSSGRKPEIPTEIQQALINELNDQEGFSSYKEIQTWLYSVHNLDVTYKVVHDTVRYRLKAKLKVYDLAKLR